MKAAAKTVSLPTASFGCPLAPNRSLRHSPSVRRPALSQKHERSIGTPVALTEGAPALLPLVRRRTPPLRHTVTGPSYPQRSACSHLVLLKWKVQIACMRRADLNQKHSELIGMTFTCNGLPRSCGESHRHRLHFPRQLLRGPRRV